MVSHSSVVQRQETPHVSETSKINISSSLKRRAQSVIADRSIDAQSRAFIRYALEINDPWLAELVRRVDEGESIVDTLDFSQTPEAVEPEEKIEALTEMICRAGDEAAAALLVLMATLEDAAHSKALANAAKHLAFTHCGELNVCRMVDAQIALLEGDLLPAA